jgi:hypothetical protein
MSGPLAVIGRTVRQAWRSWTIATVGFVLAYYVLQLLVLYARFGHWPNYFTVYDYPTNVARIVRATPAIADMVPIILDEWLLEIGYMNYDFGHGIAEWSLAILPAKLLCVGLLGAVVSTDILLLRGADIACSAGTRRIATGATGLGAFLFGLANVSLTWIVCCATPSWVVSLTLLGFGTATSLSLAPYGAWLALVGAAILGASTILLASRRGAPIAVGKLA